MPSLLSKAIAEHFASCGAQVCELFGVTIKTGSKTSVTITHAEGDVIVVQRIDTATCPPTGTRLATFSIADPRLLDELDKIVKEEAGSP